MRHPYAEVELTSDGSIHDPAQLAAAIDMVKASDPTDVVFLVHGWNNDMPAARALYEKLDARLADVTPNVPGAAQRKLAVIGILWPSVKWADDDQIAGGGAGVGDPEAALAADIATRVTDPEVRAQLVALVPELQSSPTARAEYLQLLRSLIPETGAADDDPPPPSLTEGDTAEVFDAARTSGGLTGAPATGGGAGLDIGGILRAARNLLNLTTYYTMKDRAATVGRGGIAQTLEAVHAADPAARLHLVGHSFGARAATAAVQATTAPVSSLSLLQAAFSHFAIATDYDGNGRNGAFHGIPAKLDGPVIITHTRNDRAVGIAYAVASRLARQSGAAIGDKDDPYGGMGSNGAQRTPEAGPATALLDLGGHYDLAPHRVTNLLADQFVKGHSDITNPQVAQAILAAITTASPMNP